MIVAAQNTLSPLQPRLRNMMFLSRKGNRQLRLNVPVIVPPARQRCFQATPPGLLALNSNAETGDKRANENQRGIKISSLSCILRKHGLVNLWRQDLRPTHKIPTTHCRLLSGIRDDTLDTHRPGIPRRKNFSLLLKYAQDLFQVHAGDEQLRCKHAHQTTCHRGSISPCCPLSAPQLFSTSHLRGRPLCKSTPVSTIA